MTDINKALAFAKECLKWQQPQSVETICGLEFFDGHSVRSFYLTVEDVQVALAEFLGQRFFIQMNRGTSNLFKWSVIVGLQSRSTAPPVHEHGRGEGDDMLDAIFDACLAAIRLYPATE